MSLEESRLKNAGSPAGGRPVTEPGRPGLLRAGATVGALTAGGRALGYARNVVVAAMLGAGPVADAFFVAFRAAGFLRGMFGGRGVGAAFIPMFTRRLASGGPEPARAFAGQVLSFGAAALAVLVALLELAAPWLVGVLVPGFEDDAERHSLTVLLVRIMLPFVLFASLAQLVGGMLNGYGRFAAAAALPSLFNALVISALLILGERMQTPAHALAWGIAFAGAAQLVLVWLAAQRAGFVPSLGRPRLGSRVRRMLRRTTPAATGVGAEQAVMLVDLGLASLLAAGAMSWLHYAERVARLLPSVAGAAAAVVLLPHLARRRSHGKGAAERHAATGRTLEAVLLIGLPAAAALVVAGEPLVAALFLRGAFGAEAAAATAAGLTAYAAAVPAWMLVRTLAATCFSRGDTVAPMLSALAAVVLNLVLSRLLMNPLGHVGIALGTAVAVWLQAAALLVVLARQGAFMPDVRVRRQAAAVAMASLVMAGALWVVRLALDADPAGGELDRWATLAVMAVVGSGTFLLAARLFGAVKLSGLVQAWRSDELAHERTGRGRGPE